MIRQDPAVNRSILFVHQKREGFKIRIIRTTTIPGNQSKEHQDAESQLQDHGDYDYAVFLIMVIVIMYITTASSKGKDPLQRSRIASVAI